VSENFREGNVPLRADPLRRLTVKLLNAVNAGGGGGGGGGGSGNLAGVVDPNGTVTGTAVGQAYTNTALQKFWIFEGTVGTNTGWEQFI
jgi:hypothetical protein